MQPLDALLFHLWSTYILYIVMQCHDSWRAIRIKDIKSDINKYMISKNNKTSFCMIHSIKKLLLKWLQIIKPDQYLLTNGWMSIPVGSKSAVYMVKFQSECRFRRKVPIESRQDSLLGFGTEPWESGDEKHLHTFRTGSKTFSSCNKYTAELHLW